MVKDEGGGKKAGPRSWAEQKIEVGKKKRSHIRDSMVYCVVFRRRSTRLSLPSQAKDVCVRGYVFIRSAFFSCAFMLTYTGC